MKSIAHLNQLYIYQGIVSYAAYAIAIITFFMATGDVFSPLVYVILNPLLALLLGALLIRQLYTQHSRPMLCIILNLVLLLAGLILLGVNINPQPTTVYDKLIILNLFALPIFIAIPGIVASFRYKKLREQTNVQFPTTFQQQINVSYGIVLSATSMAVFATILGLCRLVAYGIFRSPLIFTILICIGCSIWFALLIAHISRRRYHYLHPILYDLILFFLALGGTYLFATVVLPDDEYIAPLSIWHIIVRLLLPFLYLFVMIISMWCCYRRLQRQ